MLLTLKVLARMLSWSSTHRFPSTEHGTKDTVVMETNDQLWQPGHLEHKHVLGREETKVVTEGMEWGCVCGGGGVILYRSMWCGRTMNIGESDLPAKLWRKSQLNSIRTQPVAGTWLKHIRTYACNWMWLPVHLWMTLCYPTCARIKLHFCSGLLMLSSATLSGLRCIRSCKHTHTHTGRRRGGGLTRESDSWNVLALGQSWI